MEQDLEPYDDEQMNKIASLVAAVKEVNQIHKEKLVHDS